MESNKQKTTQFLTNAKANHTEYSSQLNVAKERQLEQSNSHSQKLQKANREVCMILANFCLNVYSLEVTN